MNGRYLLASILVLANGAFSPLLTASQEGSEVFLRDPFTWSTVDTDFGTGIGGSFWGVGSGVLIVAGGETQALAGETAFSDAIRLRSLDADRPISAVSESVLKRPTAHGASASTPDGIICVGGITRDGVSREVFRIRYDPVARDVILEGLPPLPEASAFAGAVLHDSILYVVGGSSAQDGSSPSNSVWVLDLGDYEGVPAEWQQLDSWPGEGRLSPLVSVRFNGFSDFLILVGGTTSNGMPPREVFGFDFKKKMWTKLRDLPEPVRIRSAIEVGVAHVFALTDSDTSGRLSFLAYHTITDTWTRTEPLPVEGIPLVALKDDDSLVLVTEGKHRRLEISTGVPPRVGKGMHVIDNLIVLGYIAVLIFLGYHFSGREKTTDDFFRGGKRISGWVAGISILGTRWSAISFMSIPAKAFATNWVYYITQFGHVIAAFVVVRYILTFFCKLNVTTAYEYLDRRFGFVVRSIGSIKFVLFDIFRMGVLILLPSMVLSVITGIHIYYCILVIGVVSTLYTYLGGIEAVIWSDVMQLCIMIGGVLIAIGVALARVDDPISAFRFAAESGKTEVFDLRFSLTTLTVWVFLLSLPGSANEEVSAQYICSAVRLGKRSEPRRHECLD